MIRFLAVILLLASCSPVTKIRDRYQFEYRSGDLLKTDELISRAIQKELPENRYTRSNDAVMLLADRGLNRFVQGDSKGAIADFDLCVQALDYYTQKSSQDLLRQLISQDDSSPFVGDEYEQLLTRIYFALALIQEGDISNGIAILRQAEEGYQEKESQYQNKQIFLPDDRIGKYLFAALLEKRGDLSNSRILYNQSGSAYEPNSNNKATVLVFCHNGNAPRKVTHYTDGSRASLIALELLLSGTACKPFALSSITGLPIPALVVDPGSLPIPTSISLDGQNKKLAPIFSVFESACQELDAKIPIITARGAARYIIRRSCVMAAQEQDPALGLAVDIGMLIANAHTQADTRALNFLPYQIELARFDVEKGNHSFEVSIPYLRGEGRQAFRLILNAKDLVIIHIFNIHPGVCRVVIPCSFLGETI